MRVVEADIAEQFTGLSDSARVWIYQSNRSLSDPEVSLIKNQADQFLNSWNAHGAKMAAKLGVVYNRFIVLAADESQVQASGCSIDSSVKFIKSLEQQLNVDLFNRLIVTYRDKDGAIEDADLSDFESRIQSGEVTLETVVFNNLIETLGSLKTEWEVPCSSSWHRRLFS